MSELSFKVVKTGRMRGTFPKEGEITIHTFQDGKPSGAIIFRCPACRGLQHKQAVVDGPDDAPTVTTQLKCGCVRCQKAFRIRGGKCYFVDADPPIKGPELSNELKEAGAFYPSEEKKRGWQKK